MPSHNKSPISRLNTVPDRSAQLDAQSVARECRSAALHHAARVLVRFQCTDLAAAAFTGLCSTMRMPCLRAGQQWSAKQSGAHRLPAAPEAEWSLHSGAQTLVCQPARLLNGLVPCVQLAKTPVEVHALWQTRSARAVLCQKKGTSLLEHRQSTERTPQNVMQVPSDTDRTTTHARRMALLLGPDRVTMFWAFDTGPVGTDPAGSRLIPN